MILALTLSLLLPQEPDRTELSKEQIQAASAVAGLEFTDAELEMMLQRVSRNLQSYQRLRAAKMPNSVVPALSLQLAGKPDPASFSRRDGQMELPEMSRPEDLEELAFADIRELASLIKSRQVSCLELTDMFLTRLERLDEKLLCVVSMMPESARKRAKELDAMLANGTWLGPLHGIPYGAKDLLATKDAKTTWGAGAYKDQQLDSDAAVVEQLRAHGAVLIAKLSLGALAQGDQWFKGRTNNPWNLNFGSSGSSAGPAAATAAGGVPFAIGSETRGSIISPSTRCGCSSLRPTWGLVDTRGAMTLSWSMDKLGPMCRSMEDTAIVFEALMGEQASELGYEFQAQVEPDITGMVVGYIDGALRGQQAEVLKQLEELGVELLAIELPDYPVNAMSFILTCEAAAAFDELTLSDRDDLLSRQGAGAWPNSFRVHRMVPAVEYIQANRMRSLLMADMEKVMSRIDVYVHPTGTSLGLTNLTGHPAVVMPFGEGSGRGGGPQAISFTGQLYGEGKLLALAQAYQQLTDYHKRHPKLD